MDLATLVDLTTGIALLTCVVAVIGVHVYAKGRARRAACRSECAPSRRSRCVARR